MTSTPQDRYERLDYAEIWMREGLKVVDPPGLFEALEIDMSYAEQVIAKLRQEGIKVTYTHLFVRATALVLAKDPELHQLVLGNRRLVPGRVDIGVSVAGPSFVAPVVVIEDAANKTIKEIAAEIIQRAPQAREKQTQMLDSLRKWGWIVPLGGLRRWFLGLLMKQFWFCRQGVGTFQVSCLSDVDQFIPFLFSTSAILGTGQVRDRVVAIHGQPQVRPTVIASCCADHKIWDGIKTAKFLTELNDILNSEVLVMELNTKLA